MLWRKNPNEKIVIFATYLGTVDLIAKEIEAALASGANLDSVMPQMVQKYRKN